MSYRIFCLSVDFVLFSMLLVISNEFYRLYRSNRKLFYIVIVMFFIFMIAMGFIFYLFWRDFL